MNKHFAAAALAVPLVQPASAITFSKLTAHLHWFERIKQF
jgi:hypothetical protein